MWIISGIGFSLFYVNDFKVLSNHFFHIDVFIALLSGELQIKYLMHDVINKSLEVSNLTVILNIEIWGQYLRMRFYWNKSVTRSRPLFSPLSPLSFTF